MTNQERELIWVPKEVAIKYEQLSEEGRDNLILQYIDSVKQSIKNEISYLDEDILMFRGAMVKARQDFKKTKDEELENISEIWHNAEDEISLVKNKINNIRKEVEPLSEDIKEINNLLTSIFSYKIENLVEALKFINNQTTETKELIKFLIEKTNKME